MNDVISFVEYAFLGLALDLLLKCDTLTGEYDASVWTQNYNV